MFEVNPSIISGCYQLIPPVFKDSRGQFVKVYERDAFAQLGLETQFSEEYYTTSHRGVIRGMHFQSPPDDHIKIVYCVYGEVFDAVVDLRKNSQTYRKVSTFKLSASEGNYLYIPKGVAHGFCATSKLAVLVYKVSSSYSPKNDHGIDSFSIGIDWPTDSPIRSDRDAQFPALKNFISPFK
jgi:dTDP-4-dehydrorhamnose 3,5-epimerase